VETIILLNEKNKNTCVDLFQVVPALSGFNLILAEDAEEAVKFCRENNFQARLLIAEMPERDWQESLERIGKADINTLFLYGSAPEELIRRGLLRFRGWGNTFFLRKPFLPNVLARKIRSIFEIQAHSRWLAA